MTRKATLLTGPLGSFHLHCAGRCAGWDRSFDFRVRYDGKCCFGAVKRDIGRTLQIRALSAMKWRALPTLGYNLWS